MLRSNCSVPVASYFLNTAAGPTIVLVNTAAFLVALALRSKRA